MRVGSKRKMLAMHADALYDLLETTSGRMTQRKNPKISIKRRSAFAHITALQSKMKSKLDYSLQNNV